MLTLKYNVQLSKDVLFSFKKNKDSIEVSIYGAIRCTGLFLLIWINEYGGIWGHIHFSAKDVLNQVIVL